MKIYLGGEKKPTDSPAIKNLQTSIHVLWQHLSGYINTSPKKNWGKKAGILTDTNLRAGTLFLPLKIYLKYFEIQKKKMCGH